MTQASRDSCSLTSQPLGNVLDEPGRWPLAPATSSRSAVSPPPAGWSVGCACTCASGRGGGCSRSGTLGSVSPRGTRLVVVASHWGAVGGEHARNRPLLLSASSSGARPAGRSPECGLLVWDAAGTRRSGPRGCTASRFSRIPPEGGPRGLQRARPQLWVPGDLLCHIGWRPCFLGTHRMEPFPFVSPASPPASRRSPPLTSVRTVTTAPRR